MNATDPFEERHRATREVGRYMGHGLTWALSVLLFLWIGYRLDGWLGTLPVFTIVGAFVGGAGGFLHLYRGLTRTSSRDPDAK